MCVIYSMLAWACVLLTAVTTLYVRKEEDKVYNALLLESLTVHEFKLQVCAVV